MKVKDCMCNDVCCVKPNTSLNQVAKIMSENHIGCVPVCDENNAICGIVTDRDILLRAVACEKDTKNCQVSEIMTSNVCTCSQEDELAQAQKQMNINQIRRLPVCDNNNQVIGILTLGNLVQNDQQIGQQQVCNTFENICDCNAQKNAQ